MNNIISYKEGSSFISLDGENANELDWEDNIEPTLVYTNVEGGLGCFASFNAVGKTINP